MRLIISNLLFCPVFDSHMCPSVPVTDSFWSSHSCGGFLLVFFSAGAGESKEDQADRQRRDRFGTGKCSYMSIMFIHTLHFLDISGVDEGGGGLRKGDKKLLKKIR